MNHLPATSPSHPSLAVLPALPLAAAAATVAVRLEPGDYGFLQDEGSDGIGNSQNC